MGGLQPHDSVVRWNEETQSKEQGGKGQLDRSSRVDGGRSA